MLTTIKVLLLDYTKRFPFNSEDKKQLFQILTWELNYSLSAPESIRENKLGILILLGHGAL